MLRGLGIDLHPGALAEVWRILLEMWAENGDRMAKQYGGSGAMHKVMYIIALEYFRSFCDGAAVFRWTTLRVK